MLTEFLQYMELELNRSRLTVDAYGRDLRELAAFLGHGEEMEDAAAVSTSDVRAWLADMARKGLSPRGLSPRTQPPRP